MIIDHMKPTSFIESPMKNRWPFHEFPKKISLILSEKSTDASDWLRDWHIDSASIQEILFVTYLV